MEGAILIQDLVSQGTVDSQTLASPQIACVVGEEEGRKGAGFTWTDVCCITSLLCMHLI